MSDKTIETPVIENISDLGKYISSGVIDAAFVIGRSSIDNERAHIIFVNKDKVFEGQAIFAMMQVFEAYTADVPYPKHTPKTERRKRWR